MKLRSPKFWPAMATISNKIRRDVQMMALVLILLSSGAQSDASEFSPPTMVRRAGQPPPAEKHPETPPMSVVVPDQDCPMIQVPALIFACRRPPGLPACAAQCVAHHYRGGYCDMQRNGRPGDCYCRNCLGSQA